MAQYSQNQKTGGQHSRGGSRQQNPINPRKYEGVPFVVGGNINPRLVTDVAEKVIEDLSSGKTISSAQLRRFYGAVKDYSNQLITDDDYAKLYPMIKMLKSLAYYAYDRNKIPLQFANFFVGLIDQVKENEVLTFKAAAKHFEAVVGFMYGKGLVS
jgi:CRISPR type III-A-associated protein Csm2